MKNLMQKFKSSPKWFKITVTILLVIGIIVHLLLPPVIKYYLNKELDNLDGHYGYVEDVDLSIFRGAYSIEGLHLYSDELGKEYPLALIDDIDISIQWKALFKGSLVAEIEFLNPKVNFIIESVEGSKPTKVTKNQVEVAAAEKLEGVNNEKRRERILNRKEKSMNKQLDQETLAKVPDINQTTNNFDKIQLTVFRDFLLDQIPLNVNRIETKNGTLRYIDKSGEPTVDIISTEINFQMNNLTNSNALSQTLIADFNLTALLMGTGKLAVDGALDPYDKDVTVDIDFKLDDFELKDINEMFMAYAGFDVDKGVISIYSEVSTKQGNLEGYIKPFVEGLSILDYEMDKDETTLNFLWQTLLGGSSRLTRNFRHNEIATKIPLKGNVTEPNFKTLNTVGNLFLHAIFHVIKPEIDAKYNLRS